MKSIPQILAIARTEFRFGLRRGAPVVVTAVIGIILGAAILLTPLANLDIQAAEMKTMEADVTARWTAVGIDIHQLDRLEFADMLALGAVFGWNMIWLALVFLPVAAVIAVPADRAFGALELLKSMPLNGFKYLVGKILGTLAVVLLVGTAALLLFFMVIEMTLIRVLHFNITMDTILFYTKLAVMDGLPMLLWGTLGGVLLGIFFRTRRAALFPGLVFGLLSWAVWGSAFRPPANNFGIPDVATYSVLQNYTSPADPVFIKLGLDPMPPLLGAGAARIGIGPVLVMYTALLLILLTLIGLACLWLKKKENF